MQTKLKEFRGWKKKENSSRYREGWALEFQSTRMSGEIKSSPLKTGARNSQTGSDSALMDGKVSRRKLQWDFTSNPMKILDVWCLAVFLFVTGVIEFLELLGEESDAVNRELKWRRKLKKKNWNLCQVADIKVLEKSSGMLENTQNNETFSQCHIFSLGILN